MKAGIYHGPKDLRVEEIDIPSVGPNQVLVETRVSGICGSDLHVFYGDWTQPEARVATGHELSGVVVGVGEDIVDIAVGDRVCAECFHHCGHCDYCMTGQYNLCRNIRFQSRVGPGGFAEYALLPVSAVFKLPASLSFEEGALVEPLAVSYRAVCKTKAMHGDKIAVLGAGTIGLYCVATAKAIGIDDISITAKYDHQAKLAQRLGANHVIRTNSQDNRKDTKATYGDSGYDAVVDTLALDESFDDALAIVRKGGTVSLVGGYTKSLNVGLRPVVDKELHLLGSLCYGYSGMKTDFQTCIDLIAEKKVDAPLIVTHRFPLDKLPEAFRVAADKNSGSVKVHISQ
jgi:2-desacetyl-2-hydroxyethyl bacteriochlorophyllide A dehydrogenase